MSVWIIVIGVALGLIAAALVYRHRDSRADVMSALLVVAIAAVAVVVTFLRVQQYHDQQASAAAANEALSASAAPQSNEPQPPPLTNRPPVAPVALPTLSPTTRGPTGSAAPPAVENPYAGSGR